MFETRLGLNHGHIAFGIVDFRKQVPLLDPAATVNLQRFDEARNLGIQRGKLERPNRTWLARDSLHPATLGLDDLHFDETVFLVAALVGIRLGAFFCLLVSVGHEPEPTSAGTREHDDHQA